MAGSSMTFAYDDIGGIRRITADWVSDSATGAVTGTTRKIVGTLIKGLTNPGATAPSDNYDIAITDEESHDVLAGCIAACQLANRDTTNTEEVYFFLLNSDASALSMAAHPVVADVLTIAITNAGNSKVGRLVLYYRAA